eukprot:356968-Chlamydomonas_euryale.AAC.9
MAHNLVYTMLTPTCASAGSPADPIVSLYTDDGQHLTTFCDSDGSFVLQGTLPLHTCVISCFGPCGPMPCLSSGASGYAPHEMCFICGMQPCKRAVCGKLQRPHAANAIDRLACSCSCVIHRCPPGKAHAAGAPVGKSVPRDAG